MHLCSANTQKNNRIKGPVSVTQKEVSVYFLSHQLSEMQRCPIIEKWVFIILYATQKLND